MTVTIEQVQGVKLCKIEGELDMYAAPELFAACDRILSREGSPRLILDLGATSYMDSSGIGVVFQLFSAVRKRGGSFCLCGVHGMVSQLFTLSRMNAILPVERDLESALNRMGAR